MTPDEFGQTLDEETRRVVEALAALIALGGYTSAQAARVVARGQAEVAQAAKPYIDSYTDEYAGTVNVQGLIGIASDGRPLDNLMALPIATAGALRAGGASSAEVARAFADRAMMLGATMVQDTGRVATSLHIVSSPSFIGYQRELRGAENCSRCIILAGRIYKWNDGFERHPNCNCVHVPMTRGEAIIRHDPQAIFDAMPEARQAKVFTNAGAQAIRDGADIYQVVNARRGMRTTVSYSGRVMSRRYTTWVNSRSGRRFMPEQIYKTARDRDHALALLQRHGYLTGGAQRAALTPLERRNAA